MTTQEKELRVEGIFPILSTQKVDEWAIFEMSLTEKERTKVYYPRGYKEGSKYPPPTVQKLQQLYPAMMREVLAAVSPSQVRTTRHLWEC